VTPKTETLVSALRILSIEIQSGDGVANAVVAEAADRLTLMANLVARHIEETKKDTAEMQTACETMNGATETIQRLKERINRLEEAGDAMLDVFSKDPDKISFDDWVAITTDARTNWREAKEAKP
jgi:hypothetical protein